MERESGLLFHHDIRDEQFKYEIVSYFDVPYKYKEWWDDGWWGDQGNTPHCNAYSWLHILADGPVFQDSPNPILDPKKLYDMCKEIDNISGKGTTVHAGAKIIKDLGYLTEYRWITSLEALIMALLVHGPVIAGTHWYSGMDNPDSRGKVKVSGSSRGGHAYVINGVDIPKQLFRFKNSYGKKWGKDGHGYISFDDMKKLIENGSTICVPFVKKPA